MSKPTHSAAEAFIERLGLSAEADGLPRIAGRMWGFFIIHGGPCSFTELAERLQVSRGSISTNARILRDLGIIERVSRPGDRQDYYQLANNPYHRLMEGYIQRMRGTLRSVEEAIDQLPEGWTDAKQRLQNMHEFHAAAIEVSVQLIQDLQAKAGDWKNVKTQTGQ
ncbi:MAG: MarR family transcriptional regulator [Salinisphaeraceae bacterium]|nr:MarR family transcriptional regulator [Salinisphaeraceae bacterium]